jgi:hypothetical protein
MMKASMTLIIIDERRRDIVDERQRGFHQLSMRRENISLTVFRARRYSSRQLQTKRGFYVQTTHAMQSTQVYYFAFTFRFSFGEGRLRRCVRARETT